MKRVAIYARYSSDQQTDASIEDQIRICEERAAKEGWTVINRYTDHGISGASMMRPGIQMLMQDAQSGKFDTVIAEALDRMSRDQEDIAGIFKRLQFAGIEILTLSEGEVSNLHIGLKGTMNALFLKDLADKTRRGLRGRVEAGKSGGGLTYGYDVVSKLDDSGEPIRGERTINPDHARIVERIFREYVAGKSPKKIALDLNTEGVPGPTGNGWGPSTIHGNRRRGTGILNNDLYVGRMVWNRLRYIKDPETGKRVSRPNPEDAWIVRDVPELRIIDQDLWEAAKIKQGIINAPQKQFWEKQRPKNLFSYLIKCGCCGGGCSMVSQSRIGCSNARNKGTCDNRLTISRQVLEEAVLGALQHHLMDEHLCNAFCEEYTKHINRLRMDRNASLDAFKREYAKIDGDLDKLVEAIIDGVPPSKVKEKMIALENRRDELKLILDSTEEAPTLLHPNMAKRYHQEVRSLITALNDVKHRTEAADLLRTLIERIVLTPTEAGKKLAVDLIGDLAGILSVAAADGKGSKGDKPDLDQIAAIAGRKPFTDNGSTKTKRPPAKSHAGAYEKQDKLVAGACLSFDLSGQTERKDKMVAGARNPLCYNCGAGITPAFRDEVENTHQLAA